MPALHAYNAGMKTRARKPAKKARQYTIRAVPPELDAELRRRAKKLGKSLNEVTLEALKRGAGIDAQPVVHTDLDHLIGTWIEDPEFDAAIAAQDVVDEEKWR